jgi:hypothetical protein
MSRYVALALAVLGLVACSSPTPLTASQWLDGPGYTEYQKVEIDLDIVRADLARGSVANAEYAGGALWDDVYGNQSDGALSYLPPPPDASWYEKAMQDYGSAGNSLNQYGDLSDAEFQLAAGDAAMAHVSIVKEK